MWDASVNQGKDKLEKSQSGTLHHKKAVPLAIRLLPKTFLPYIKNAC
jgi:hypothetical protein